MNTTQMLVISILIGALFIAAMVFFAVNVR